MIDLSLILDDKIASLEKHLQAAIFERDHSATPMESHSDKTRQIAEHMIDSLNDEKKKLQDLKKQTQNYRPHQFRLSTSYGDRQYLLVPEGLGGEVIDGVTLLSETSPLGSRLITATVGSKVSLNGNDITVLDIQ